MFLLNLNVNNGIKVFDISFSSVLLNLLWLLKILASSLIILKQIMVLNAIETSNLK